MAFDDRDFFGSNKQEEVVLQKIITTIYFTATDNMADAKITWVLVFHNLPKIIDADDVCRELLAKPRSELTYAYLSNPFIALPLPPPPNKY